jgi:transcriptional regulator with XRE-family HTH domain
LSVVRSGVASGAGYSLLMRSEPPLRPALLRELIGESLREERVAQGKTLREVSKAAKVSLGYLSEVERGQKEASSELLAAMCSALDLPLSVVLNLVSEKLALVESAADDRVTALPRVRALAQAAA